MKPIRTVLLALSMAMMASSNVLAFGHDHGGRPEGREGGRGGGYEARGRGGNALAGVGDPRDRGRGPRYDGYSGYPEPRGYTPPPYARAPYDRGGFAGYIDDAPPPPIQPFRRGQYLPHAYWGEEIANPRSRHLRTPPPGYGWIGVGPNAYLMQRSTGLVLDSVPGAW